LHVFINFEKQYMKNHLKNHFNFKMFQNILHHIDFLSLRNRIKIEIWKCFQNHLNVCWMTFFLCLKKILFIFLLHFELMININIKCIYNTETKYENQFHISKLNSNHIFQQFILMKTLKKICLIWSKFIFEKLINSSILLEKH
jgi:hypothetical protein